MTLAAKLLEAPGSILAEQKGKVSATKKLTGERHPAPPTRRGGRAVAVGLAVAEISWADYDTDDPLLNRTTFHVSARVGLVRRSSDDPNRRTSAG